MIKILTSVVIFIACLVEPFTYAYASQNVHKTVSLCTLDTFHSIDTIKMALKKAKKGDIITLNISSNGGKVKVLFELLNAIDFTKGTVRYHIVSHASSSGALIALYGDSFTYNKYSYVLFHRPSIQGKFLNLNHPLERLHFKLLDKVGHDCLTKKEVTNIIKGDDVILLSENLAKNCKKFKDRKAGWIYKMYLEAVKFERFN